MATDPWGVTVERVELKDVRVPEQLMRAMAAEAEAAREARAKVIAAEGEHKASRALRHAAEVITDCPAALQVRQVLNQASLQHFINIFRISIKIFSSTFSVCVTFLMPYLCLCHAYVKMKKKIYFDIENICVLFQLRYLQTLNSISAEHNSTIVFPVPIDLLSNFMHQPGPPPAPAPTD